MSSSRGIPVNTFVTAIDPATLSPLASGLLLRETSDDTPAYILRAGASMFKLPSPVLLVGPDGGTELVGALARAPVAGSALVTPEMLAAYRRGIEHAREGCAMQGDPKDCAAVVDAYCAGYDFGGGKAPAFVPERQAEGVRMALALYDANLKDPARYAPVRVAQLEQDAAQTIKAAARAAVLRAQLVAACQLFPGNVADENGEIDYPNVSAEALGSLLADSITGLQERSEELSQEAHTLKVYKETADAQVGGLREQRDELRRQLEQMQGAARVAVECGQRDIYTDAPECAGVVENMTAAVNALAVQLGDVVQTEFKPVPDATPEQPKAQPWPKLRARIGELETTGDQLRTAAAAVAETLDRSKSGSVRNNQEMAERLRSRVRLWDAINPGKVEG